MQSNAIPSLSIKTSLINAFAVTERTHARTHDDKDRANSSTERNADASKQKH